MVSYAVGDVTVLENTISLISRQGSAAQRWILRRPAPASAHRLFCFCYAGGNAAVFLPWQAALGVNIEVCAIQLPGHGARFGEPFLDSMASAVAAIATAITPLLDRPFSFFGHSLGALLAFEVSHHLRAHALPLPQQLIVSGAQGPHSPRSGRQIHLLDDAELKCELERYSGTPQAILNNPEFLMMVLPIIRADFRIVNDYVSTVRPPLPVKISVFAGRDDEMVDAEQCDDWFAETTSRGKLHWFDGNHFFINTSTEQVLEQLATIVSSAR